MDFHACDKSLNEQNTNVSPKTVDMANCRKSSTIEKLGISGVRSFGPKDEDKQVITFHKPLTLILGPNGAGKTTIVECLKYATTGDFPPGSRRGATFVHDAKLTEEGELMAHVKLEFEDISGGSCTVDRWKPSVDAKGQKQNDHKFQRKDSEGKITNQSIPARIADLNNLIIDFMGISKAVLENVIFCHQEDSYWPLSEGKVVKDKFDDIFASTRYSKALEVIRGLQKQMDENIKSSQSDLEVLKYHKQRACELTKKLNGLKTELERSETTMLSINNQTDLIMKKLGELRGRKEEEQDKWKKREEKLGEEQSEQQREEKELREEIGQLRNEEQRCAGNLKEMKVKLKEAFELCNFKELTEEQLSDSSMYGFYLLEIERKLKNLNEEVEENKAKLDQEEQELQDEIVHQKESKAKLEVTIKTKETTFANNKDKIEAENRKLESMTSLAAQKASKDVDLKEAEEKLAELKKSTDVNDVQKNIKEMEAKERTLHEAIDKLSNEMVQLYQRSDTQTRLDINSESQRDKENTVSGLKEKLEKSISSLLGSPLPEDKWRESLSSFISAKNSSAETLSRNVILLERELSRQKDLKKNETKLLGEKEAELQELEEKVLRACKGRDAKEIFSEVKKELAQAREERSCLSVSKAMTEKYISKLRENNPACPLCSHRFQNDEEVHKVIKKLREEQEEVPKQLKDLEQSLKSLEEREGEMSQICYDKEVAEDLRNNTIPELKRKIRQFEEDVQVSERQISEKEQEKSVNKQDLQTAQDLQPEIAKINSLKVEIQNLDRNIEKQKEEISEAGGGVLSGKNMVQVKEERKAKDMELRTTTNDVKKLKAKLDEHHSQVFDLEKNILSLQNKQMTIEHELQKKATMKQQRDKLEDENEVILQEINEGKIKVKPIEERIKKLVDEISKAKEQKAALMTDMKRIEDLTMKVTEMKKLTKEIDNYTQSGKQKRLEQCQGSLDESKKKWLETEKKQKYVRQRFEDLMGISSQQMLEGRELQNFADMLLNQADRDELNDVNIQIIKQEERQLNMELKGLEMKKNTENETKQQLIGQIKVVETDLSSEVYRNVNEEYSNKIIESRTSELTRDDLRKYYHLLDTAITQYHTAKMKDINCLVKELWNNTYMNNDIDNIEVQFEKEDASTNKSDSKKRQSYNYRVVMFKNGVAMDMRGRCSAGQKVLASLIIRLALAETFCVDCGIFALDEPTTNLDCSNIESLAGSLSRVIKDRNKGKNFQLLVITHDQNFVEMLGRAESVDEYIKVSKNDEGLSKLTMEKVADLSA